jgi:flagellin-like protein
LLPLTYTITPKGGIERKMKILKSKKALSPVVASIILIAVTVAVSIAVAAWMGALTFTFMKTEELKITGVTFPSANNTVISVTNTGANTLTVSSITIDDVAHTPSAWGGSFVSYSLAKGVSGTITINDHAWTSGYKYTYAILTTSGNKYTYTTTAAP